MAALGQKPALPRRSIDVRFALNKQTLTGRVQCDAMCQLRTHAPQQKQLFDHLVGAQQRGGGTFRPSAFAVLRLITSSYLVGACTGRSAGLAPRGCGRRSRPRSRYVSFIGPVGSGHRLAPSRSRGRASTAGNAMRAARTTDRLVNPDREMRGEENETASGPADDAVDGHSMSPALPTPSRQLHSERPRRGCSISQMENGRRPLEFGHEQHARVPGTVSLSMASRLPTISCSYSRLIPVELPPGLAKMGISLLPTGSRNIREHRQGASLPLRARWQFGVVARMTSGFGATNAVAALRYRLFGRRNRLGSNQVPALDEAVESQALSNMAQSCSSARVMRGQRR